MTKALAIFSQRTEYICVLTQRNCIRGSNLMGKTWEPTFFTRKCARMKLCTSVQSNYVLFFGFDLFWGCYVKQWDYKIVERWDTFGCFYRTRFRTIESSKLKLSIFHAILMVVIVTSVYANKSLFILVGAVVFLTKTNWQFYFYLGSFEVKFYTRAHVAMFLIHFPRKYRPSWAGAEFKMSRLDMVGHIKYEIHSSDRNLL